MKTKMVILLVKLPTIGRGFFCVPVVSRLHTLVIYSLCLTLQIGEYVIQAYKNGMFQKVHNTLSPPITS